ncbi:adenosine deaminase [Aquibacillus rhizosphaerae]|uniref:adenosine deaminase n=1 Tax=Aquibacillus rhizosphaerae TaxID=3051431 RepID=A0ABT7L1D0_9BACI|nr:adenosine deaminase [Aquibacillus sp. LR5S19]MDL4839597.1 adenosine deaminase [Aquibacillus sp. LR5S19]
MILESMVSVIKQLPKVDLHVHLDGSVTPETVIDLANKQGIALPTSNPQQLAPYLKIDGECNSLQEYLSKFDFVGRVLHTSEALEKVAFEVVEQAHKQNCRYIEVRFGPQLHRQAGLSLEEVIHSVIKGLKRAEKVYNVQASAIACCLRHHSIKENIDVVEAASTFMGKGLVGVDLAGDEATFPAYLFRDVFKIADKKSMPITIHAGEAAGPNNIKEAVFKLGATRVGHGVRLKEDLKLFQELYAKQIPLEMCPISNIQTKAAPSWEMYPLREYFNEGLLVTVNTDNLTVSNTNLTKEFSVLFEKHDFSILEIGQLNMNSIEASFLEASEKKKLKNKFLVEYQNVDVTSRQVI